MQIREELSFAITQPIAHPDQYAAMGLGAATGVLLYGPPGCGKTLVAKAIANESGVNFISIKVVSLHFNAKFRVENNEHEEIARNTGSALDICSCL